MSNFDKEFMLALYNSFLKMELNCDKENMLILNTYSFEDKTLSNLTNLSCVLIYVDKICS